MCNKGSSKNAQLLLRLFFVDCKTDDYMMDGGS